MASRMAASIPCRSSVYLPEVNANSTHPKHHQERPKNTKNTTNTAGTATMLRAPSQSSWYWRVLETVYAIPTPPPRKRTKPMEVICVGMPRSGTESLQHALLTLGYDHTYHGFDMSFEEEMRLPGWVALARRKWYGDGSGTARITADEFDALLGHSVAVTDVAASCFAVELIDAYPEAKVVLNMRADLDAWHRSTQETLLNIWDSKVIYLASWFNRELWWVWHGFLRYFLTTLFRAPDGDLGTAIRKNGKLVYRDHCNMIRGLVPPERLLEWNIGDGWEPLCAFLDKPVPEVPFPHSNAAGDGWKKREEQVSERWVKTAMMNLVMLGGLLGGLGYAVAYKLR